MRFSPGASLGQYGRPLASAGRWDCSRVSSWVRTLGWVPLPGRAAVWAPWSDRPMPLVPQLLLVGGGHRLHCLAGGCPDSALCLPRAAGQAPQVLLVAQLGRTGGWDYAGEMKLCFLPFCVIFFLSPILLQPLK